MAPLDAAAEPSASIAGPHLGRTPEPHGDAGGRAVAARGAAPRAGHGAGAAGGRRAGRRGAAPAAARAAARALRHAARAPPGALQGAVHRGGAGRLPGAGELRGVGRAQRRPARLVAATHRSLRRRALARRGRTDGRQHEPGAQFRAGAVERHVGPPLGVLGGSAERLRAVHGAVRGAVAPGRREQAAAGRVSAAPRVRAAARRRSPPLAAARARPPYRPAYFEILMDRIRGTSAGKSKAAGASTDVASGRCFCEIAVNF